MTLLDIVTRSKQICSHIFSPVLEERCVHMAAQAKNWASEMLFKVNDTIQAFH